MKNLAKNNLSGIAKGLNIPVAVPIEASKRLFGAYFDYKKVCQIEQTKREYIRAERDIALARIQAQRDIIQQYLSNTFKERSLAITKMFEALDTGIATGNDHVISIAMDSIISIIKESPLKEVQQMMAQLDDPNVEEIEI